MLERVYYWLEIRRFKMPPCIMSSQFTSHYEPHNIFLNNCYPFGPGMAEFLSSEPVSSTPAGRLTVLGHMTQVTMVWWQRLLYFWQHFPANLVKIVLVGIARRALPILEKMKYFKKSAELKRNKNDTEKVGKGSYLECHSRQSHKNYLSEESLVMDGIEQPFINSSNIIVNNMHLEEEGISELCLINPTIVFDLGNNWEGKDIGCVAIKSPGHIPLQLLEDAYHPEVFTKGLGFCGCLEKTLDCFNPNGKLNFDNGLGPILETTIVPQELEKNMTSNREPVIYEEQSLKHSLDSSKDEEQPEMNRENEDTCNMDFPTILNSFKSPLVLSLFYSPLEEEEDDDSSEDWWSEDEMEESSQAQTYSGGSNSGEVENCLEVEDDDSVQQVAFEKLHGALSIDSDPFHPLCFSKPIQTPNHHTIASLKPKDHQETAVSSYLTKTRSKPEELCHPSKPSWTREDQNAARNPETHRCCQPSLRNSTSPASTEIPLVLQQEIQVKKKVRFSPVVTVHSLVVWDYASRAARRGPWEEMARDRCRFRQRIAQVGTILEPCLAVDHRAKVWKRIHGVPKSLLEEAAGNVLFSSSSTSKQ